MDSLISKVTRFIERSGVIRVGDIIVVAVSGGVDSRVLLEILHDLSPRWSLRLIIAHLNHQLRGGESDRDELFVRALGAKLELPVEIERAEGLKDAARGSLSLQAVARERRYSFLEEVRRRHAADKIALGHTRTDQAETVLMRLIRGTGAGGLAAMAHSREGGIIRPLLETGRHEIEAFARDRGLEWVEDSSNAVPVYTRNRIRLEVLPVLAGLNPGIEAGLAQLAETTRREDEYLERVVRGICTSDWIEQEDARISMERASFLSLEPALRYRLLRMLAARLEISGRGASRLEHVHLDAGMRLIEEGKGTRLACWPGHIVLTVTPARIELTRGLPPDRTDRREGLLEIPGVTPLPTGGEIRAAGVSWERFPSAFTDRNVCWLDLESLELPLRVRYPERGDRFHPLGAPAPTRLSEFFIRQKVPRSERSRTPLVFSGEQIVWIPGLRSAEPGKLTPASRNVVRLEYVCDSFTDPLAMSDMDRT